MKTEYDAIVSQHIITLLNLEHLPEPERTALIEKMVDVVQQRVMLKVLDSVGADKRDAFVQVVDSGTDNEVQDFLSKNVPNFLDILQDEIVGLKKEMVELVGK